MLVASQLIAQVEARGAKETEGQLLGVGRASDAAGGMLKSLAIGAVVGAGAALVGLGAKAVDMAGGFQEAMTSLVTGAGESEANLQRVSDGILAMAGPVGETTQQLSAGMYLIESSGQHGAKALETLRDAAEGARVGAASLADVANGVTTEMTDYAAVHLSAADATNTLIAAVSQGKTHMGDLSRSMATILPTSSALGVSLTDTAAAMSTMTAEGTPAASAATYLKQTLIALEAPASKGAAALKSIGLTTQEVSDEMKKSLPDTLKMIMDHLAQTYKVGSPEYVAALKNIAGGSRQMQGILELTGTHLQTFEDNVKGITDALNKGGGSITGWNKVQDDFNTKVDQAKDGVEALFISIGTKLLPVASKIMDAINPVITGLSKWVNNSNGLSGAFDKLKPIGQAISNVFNGIVTALKSSQFANLATTLSSIFAPALQKVSDLLSGSFKSGMDTLNGIQSSDVAAWLEQAAQGADDFLLALQGFQDGSSQFTQAGMQVRDISFQVWDVMQQINSFLITTFTPDWQQLADTLNTQLIPSWNDLQSSLKPLMPTLERLAEGFGVILVGAMWLWMNVLSQVWRLVIVAFGGIVQVISGAAQTISGLVALISDIMTGNFSQLSVDLGSIWDGIVDLFRGALNLIDAITGGQVTNIVNLFKRLGIQLGDSTDDTSKTVSSNMQTMNKNVTGSFTDMANQAYVKTDMLSQNARSNFQKLGGDLADQMSSMDANIIGYWNAIADYISSHDITGTVTWVTRGAPVTPGGPVGGSIKHYAAGTDYASGGNALVGERGMELVLGPQVGYLPRGSRVVPNDQLMHGSGWGGGGKVTVEIPLVIDGKKFASVTVDDLMELAARKTRQAHGRKVF